MTVLSIPSAAQASLCLVSASILALPPRYGLCPQPYSTQSLPAAPGRRSTVRQPRAAYPDSFSVQARNQPVPSCPPRDILLTPYRVDCNDLSLYGYRTQQPVWKSIFMNCQSKKFMVYDFYYAKAKMQAIFTLQMVKI